MQDPLNIIIPTEGVDSSMPLLTEGNYLLQIVESAPKPNKRQDGYNWNLKLVTTDPATSTEGAPINPGFPVYMTIALQPAPDAQDKSGYLRGIAEAQDAIFGTTKENRPAFNRTVWEAAVGQTVMAHVIIDDYEGKKSNKIKRLKAKP